MARRLMGGNRQRERAAQVRLSARLANQMRAGVTRPIVEGMRAGAAAFQRDGVDLGIDQAVVAAMEQPLRASLTRVYTSGFDAFGQRVFDVAMKFHGARYERKQDHEERYRAQREEFIRRWVGNKVARVTRTTQLQIREIVSRGTAEAMSVDQIGRMINRQAPSIATRRGLVIARTETHSVGQAAQLEAARVSDVVQRKGWISALDDRTRDDEFSHVDADGEQIGLDDAFVRTGESLRHPGDPDGSPGNIILCRCGEEFLID